MKTPIIKIDPQRPEMDKIARCAKIIRQGGLVIFPTETVYGIAADFNNKNAMARLRQVKRRAEDKPFSMHISQKGLIANYSSSKDPMVYKLIDKCWPGPLTVIVPSHTQGQTIGIRIPDHRIALALVQESQCTVAAPSANFSGNLAPATCSDALKDLDGLVDIAIDGGISEFGRASSVVDFTKEHPIVVREGVITQEDVDRITQTKVVLFVCTGNSCRSVMAEYLLKERLKGRDHVEVLSAGTGVFVHSSASSETIAVLKRRGIDASGHLARPLDNVLLHKSDLILVMTRTHRQQVLERVPDVENRVYLIREFVSDPANGLSNLDVVDPIGCSSQTYEECIRIIEEAVDKIAKLI